MNTQKNLTYFLYKKIFFFPWILQKVFPSPSLILNSCVVVVKNFFNAKTNVFVKVYLEKKVEEKSEWWMDGRRRDGK